MSNPICKMTSQEFIRTYLPLNEALYRLAYYVLESRVDAEDAVQDLYIKLWNCRNGELDKVENPKSYCIALLRNMCIDRLRKASKRQNVSLSEGTVADITVGDDASDRRDEVKMLVRIIETLPEEQRKVMKMKVFEDLSNDEIAKRTGKSNLSVRVLLSQARKRMKNN